MIFSLTERCQIIQQHLVVLADRWCRYKLLLTDGAGTSYWVVLADSASSFLGPNIVSHLTAIITNRLFLGYVRKNAKKT